MVAQVPEDLGAWATRPRVAHGPEVLFLAVRHDLPVAQLRYLLPELARLVVVRKHRDVQALFRQPELVREEAPAVRDRVLLKVVAERKVAEHLKERVVAPREPHLLQVVVLTTGTHAPLRRRRTHVRALLCAQEHLLERHHTGVREEQRLVAAGRYEWSARHNCVAVRFKKLQEACAHSGCWQRLQSTLLSPRARRRCTREPARAPRHHRPHRCRLEHFTWWCFLKAIKAVIGMTAEISANRPVIRRTQYEIPYFSPIRRFRLSFFPVLRPSSQKKDGLMEPPSYAQPSPPQPQLQQQQGMLTDPDEMKFMLQYLDSTLATPNGLPPAAAFHNGNNNTISSSAGSVSAPVGPDAAHMMHPAHLHPPSQPPHQLSDEPTLNDDDNGMYNELGDVFSMFFNIDSGDSGVGGGATAATIAHAQAHAHMANSGSFVGVPRYGNSSGTSTGNGSGLDGETSHKVQLARSASMSSSHSGGLDSISPGFGYPSMSPATMNWLQSLGKSPSSESLTGLMSPAGLYGTPSSVLPGSAGANSLADGSDLLERCVRYSSPVV